MKFTSKLAMALALTLLVPAVSMAGKRAKGDGKTAGMSAKLKEAKAKFRDARKKATTKADRKKARQQFREAKAKIRAGNKA